MYIDAGQIIERPGHGELSSTFTGIGFVQLNLESNSLVFTIDIPNTWVYEVHIRYEVRQIGYEPWDTCPHPSLFNPHNYRVILCIDLYSLVCPKNVMNRKSVCVVVSQSRRPHIHSKPILEKIALFNITE